MSELMSGLALIRPELVVGIGAMLLLMVGVGGSWRGMRLVSWLAIAVLAVAGIALYGTPQTAGAFGGAFVTDDFARFAKALVLIGSALAIVLAQDFFEEQKIARFEFPVLVLLATLGMMLMVSASSFIGLYMGLELQSLALYVLAAFHRDSMRSTEAGLKYFVLGALSSGMMLYGISLIYGFTGTTGFAEVAAAVGKNGHSVGIIFGLVFLISGLAFKVSAVPFHMWTPDVYEGSPTPITAFFSMSPKVAAMALFLRAILEGFPTAVHEWQQIIVFISVLSMVLGAFAAIGQTNIKRLMAYSSIGHMGYALLGLAAGTTAGVQGVLLYLTIYVITNAGVFVCILAMKRGGEMVETIDDLRGLSRTNPRLAIAFLVFMFSLAGIPPMAGFFAKFYVFAAAIDAHLYWPAVIGVLASVVGAVYYIRIVKLIYFDEPAPAFDAGPGGVLSTVLVGSGVFTVLFMLLVVPFPIVGMAEQAARALVP
jgi:NADH-quinone oxidoreductase subunit N